MEDYEEHRHTVAAAAAAVALLSLIILLSVKIRTVTVTGSDRYSAEEMEELLFSDRWGKNAVFCYLADRFGTHRQIPFVDDYKIVFHGPTRVEIIVYEKAIIGYVSYMSSYMYFDRDGIIVESSASRLEGVPWVTGLEFGQIVLYKPLPVGNPDIFSEILNLTQQLSVYEISVDRIEYDTKGEATLYIGQMEVTMGENTDIDGKISLLNDILTDQPQLADTPGTLKLDTYSEGNDRAGITFKKK